MTRGLKALGGAVAASRRWLVGCCCSPCRGTVTGAEAAATLVHAQNENSGSNYKSHRPASSSPLPFWGTRHHRFMSTRHANDVQRWVPPGRWTATGPPGKRPTGNEEEGIVDQYQKVMLEPHVSIFLPPFKHGCMAAGEPDESSPPLPRSIMHCANGLSGRCPLRSRPRSRPGSPPQSLPWTTSSSTALQTGTILFPLEFLLASN